MLVAITGSSGLIGSALMRALRAVGHNPVAVTRSERPAADEIGWDPANGKIDAAGFEGVDAVIHLAGAGIGDKRWNDDRKRLILESRTQGTHLLASTLAGLQRPPEVLVSGSAIGFYGERGDTTLTEADDRGEGFLANVSVAWENAAKPAVEAGIRTCFARTGIVQSPDGGALGKVLLPFKAGVGGRLGDGKQWWSWISIDDEVGAIIHMLRRSELHGPVNLTAPNPVTNNEWTKALGKALGRPTVVPIPKFAMYGVLGKELAEELLFTSSKILPNALLDDGFVFQHPTIGDAFAAVLDDDHELTVGPPKAG